MCSVVSSCFSNSWTVARQAPLSMGFSRQEYWSELQFPFPGDLPDPGIEPPSVPLLLWQTDSLPLHHLGSPYWLHVKSKKKWYKWTYLQSRKRLVHLENEFAVTPGRRDSYRVWDLHVPTSIFKMDVKSQSYQIKSFLQETWSWMWDLSNSTWSNFILVFNKAQLNTVDEKEALRGRTACRDQFRTSRFRCLVWDLCSQGIVSEEWSGGCEHSGVGQGAVDSQWLPPTLRS